MITVDYTIFLKDQYTEGERVARVVLGANNKNQFEFILKSGQFPDTSSIITVTRTLRDFFFLRNQLLVENPEACLSDLQDLAFTTKPGESTTRTLRKMLKRLNFFILDLLSHPIFKNHELVWEFLIVPIIDEPLIISRTKMKRENMLEMIYDTVSPFVEDISKSSSYFKEVLVKLTKLQGSLKVTGAAAKRLGQSKKEFSSCLRLFRYNIGRPTFQIPYSENISISESLRAACDVFMKQGITDSWDLGDFFYDLIPSIQAILKSIQKFENAVDDYQNLEKQANILMNSVKRLEQIAKNDASEDNVKKLSEAYYHFQTTTKQQTCKASYLNNMDSSLVTELEFFNSHHAHLINLSLSDYVRRQITLEKTGVKLIEDALQSFEVEDWNHEYDRVFSAVNLSYGQGTPLSRGSLLESTPQLGPIGQV